MAVNVPSRLALSGRRLERGPVVRHPGRDPRNNPRFVVTNLPRAKKLLPNQFRVLLTLGAYILFQEPQRRARGTACADAQVTTLRERLLKLAVSGSRADCAGETPNGHHRPSDG